MRRNSYGETAWVHLERQFLRAVSWLLAIRQHPRRDSNARPPD